MGWGHIRLDRATVKSKYIQMQNYREKLQLLRNQLMIIVQESHVGGESHLLVHKGGV